MTDEDILNKISIAFREVFQDPTIVARPEMTASDVDKWDSLTHIDMIMMVEEAFGIRIPTRAITGMKNVGDLIRVIDSQLTK
jgi:acyl carrier protein